ncbi:uncharacterized protein LOC119610650 isoform X1 [Lucilia sericata]|nr:uncharacterized protein LOC119601649 isoform X2 [Lucilia sericata]XP_037808648.1 uncharacterized protein LOC119601649 isoform X2 [Lucilia sericata]XP_037815514.1 uncharacterized protein LOC119606176 isoform X1 [Lucilia sericata]XP_037821888.1 uncharacterized protein LOC119610650 isoform X1 [Lucilia sericata]
MPRVAGKRESSAIFKYYTEYSNCSDIEIPVEEEENENVFDSFDSNNSFSEGSDREQESLRDQIAQWSIKHNITNAALNDLLKIIRHSIPNLPKDCRTLKETPRICNKETIEGGTYIHYGIVSFLNEYLSHNKICEEEISINFNIDGLPVSKSSGLQVWPILGSVKKVIFIVGCFEGYSKPKNSQEFLKAFVEELKVLIYEGFTFENKVYKVSVGYFICDAPARAFVLNIKSHSGFYCCHKCQIQGEVINHKMIFDNQKYPDRTNFDFRNKTFPEHHTVLSPNALETLPIDIINKFPFDYMHVTCLGVMKSLLKAWCKDRKQNYSLSSANILILNSELLNINSHIPREFNRKSRTIKELDRWKATEHRLFLLYTGPTIMSKFLSADRYIHFLKLSLAMRVLLGENDQQYSLAENLLNSFVEEIPQLYNSYFTTYNYHCLTHLANDAKLLGSLNSVNAFEFENYLQEIKRFIHKKSFIGSQIYNRMAEKSKYNIRNFEGNKIETNVFLSFLKTQNYYFSTQHPDNYIIFQSKVFKIDSIIAEGSEYMFMGKEVLNLRDLFELPMKSSYFNIFSANSINFSHEISKINVVSVTKCLCLHFNNQFIFIPFIH